MARDVTHRLAIDDIHLAAKRRPVHQEKVKALTVSIARLGLLNPLTVSADGTLIAGLHRLQACAALGWKRVPCRVFPLSDALEQRLATIDENLIRQELMVLEIGEHLQDREEVLAAMGLRAQSGGQSGNQNAAKNEGGIIPPSFKTTADIAKEAGFSESSAHKYKQVANTIIPEVKEVIRKTKLADTITELLSLARMEPEAQQAIAAQLKVGAKSLKEAKKAIQAARKAAVPDDLPAVTDRYHLFHASLDEALLEPESVDVIMTDPPYPREYLPLYDTLAQVAARVLKPGGSCFVLVGQSYLPEVLALMTPHLNYHWTLAYLTPGGQAVQAWGRNVNTFWKPVLWLVKGEYAGDWAGDVVKSAVNDNDKRFHEWGQSESGMADLVERFTYPGQTVLDPFMGAGTTGVVAVRRNRRFLGIDIDAGHVETAKRRLALLAQEVSGDSDNRAA